MIKKISSAILAAALSCASFTGNAGGGDPGDFGDGVVLTPYLRTPFPYISLRNCWTEYKPLIRYNGETWEISWQAVEVCE